MFLILPMKTLATVLCPLALVIFSSCGLQHAKYEKNESATVAYLSEKKSAPARMNIEGAWYSPEWGIVLLNQEAGGKLTGIFAEYLHVRGVVSGQHAFLALVDDSWIEYTVELKRKSWDVLTGHYSAHTPFSPHDQKEITLLRIER